MKYIIIALSLIFVIGVAMSLQKRPPVQTAHRIVPITKSDPTNIPSQKAPRASIVAEKLDTPWGMAFLPDNSILITERMGRVRLISANGLLDVSPVATIQSVKEIGEGGLLGIAVHPDFASNHYVYLYYTFSSSGSNTRNRVVRMTYTDNKLRDEKIIINNILGASNHNGGRINFGPDKFLYIGTGDAEIPTQAQDKNTLSGKILRVTDEGKPAPGNPFGNEVFSMGHRNVQGLAWDASNNFWSTEHGPSGLGSGFDELNLIQSGKNYGWPDIQGDETKAGMETPKKNSGAKETWAPSGAAFVGNTLYFSGLRGQALYKATIENNVVTKVDKYLDGEFGRIREVMLGPDGLLYITTSNRDGRGLPKENDDKVIQINPEKL